VSHVVALFLVLTSTGAVGGEEPEGPDLRDILAALADEEFLEDPEQIMAWVTAPRSLEAGEEAELEITIENARESGAFRMSSIYIGGGFISGFDVLELSPEPRNHARSMGDVSLEYPVDIPAGETRVFRMQLRARQPGVFIGDIDVYEGERFLTRVAQTRVR
jgi:hypothetical protein